MAQNNRIVTRLVQYGGSLRSDVRRLDKALLTLAESHSETEDRLDGLIGLVDKHLRGNGHVK